MVRWLPRPRLDRAFYKAHGLGNDYLVFEEGDDWDASPENVRAVCDRFSGVGSDGIVVLADPGQPRRSQVSVELRMFNPDGGEFERSGNGLRILGSYLARSIEGLRNIDVRVGGEEVHMIVHGRAGAVHDLSVEMGIARTGPPAVDLNVGAISRTDGMRIFLPGPARESLEIVPVSIGNPHLVVVGVDGKSTGMTEFQLARLGPFLAGHAALENGANVQLAVPDGLSECRALIWERGVGRTAASGTSACAVAVAMVSSGQLSPCEIAVAMPGGSLSVTVSSDLDVVLRGPVEEVCEGQISTRRLAEMTRCAGQDCA
ncbi:MAG: diaminopimelate epimerase [Longimicrobiales bacterium]|nr:diaminopimelate epimerase [Longimicrobiales bacterium]